jgi:hypothetical protein
MQPHGVGDAHAAVELERAILLRLGRYGEGKPQ